ncbi:MAG: thioredoxin-dependent thiol peroxidase [Elusimicrobia bacterium]|nr:thioredoxin-dependent thiol peroxidase [Elusimicrobiota bacterium]
MSRLKAGDRAPQFNAPSSDGRDISLGDFAGKQRIVLYFYPKDDTPGCTQEACGFRDSIQKFTGEDVVVLGVSPDDIKSHGKFIKKFNLPFPLLSDTDKAIANAYGVWGQKSFMGKSYMGIIRTTFVIGKTGVVEKIYENVKPEGHHEEVLTFLKTKQLLQEGA